MTADLQRIQADAALGDSPLWFGEWGLSTQFNATDDFLYKWADAQKWSYSKGAGWIVSMHHSTTKIISLKRSQYWNFKTEISDLTNGTALARQWYSAQPVSCSTTDDESR